MIRLGLRLAVSGGIWSVVPSILAAVAVGLGTAILLFAMSFQPALAARYDHGAWRDTPGVRDASGLPGDAVLLAGTRSFVDGRPLARVDVAALGPDAPIPPGLDRLPRDGEAFVSPALAELLADRPDDRLGHRFGQVVGLIGEAGLMAPNELAVVNGLSAETLLAAGSRVVTDFDETAATPTLGLIVDVIVAVAVVGAIGPVAVFVATATRLAAARRERRLVALRLCGATSAQITVLAAVDALLIAVPGTLLGPVLFVLLRPAIALIPLAQLTWFPEAIAPSPLAAALIVVAVPVVGVLSSVALLRRMAISPLGVAHRVRSGPVSTLRLAPLAASLIGFAASLWLGLIYFPDLALLAIALTFFGIIVGIVVAGPWLTATLGGVLVRRAGAIPLLAGRHLLDDPRGSFGVVAGVVIAIFVACTFFGFVAFTSTVSGSAHAPIHATTVAAEVPGGLGAEAEGLTDRLGGMDGVTGVVAVRTVLLLDTAKPAADGRLAWIAPCGAFLEAADLPGAVCGTADVHLLTGTRGPNETEVATGHDATATVADLKGPPTVELAFDRGPVTARLYPPETEVEAGTLPEMVVEPSALQGDTSAIRPQFLLVSTNGEPDVVERVRTAIELALPMSGAATGAELAAELTMVLDELERVVTLGVVLAMLVAGCSLAVGVAGGLLDRRRPFALLRMSGVPLRDLQAVLVLEAAVPLVGIAAVSGILGVVASQLVLRMPGLHLSGTGATPLPDGSLLALVVGSVGLALVLVAGVLPLVRPLTSLEETRFE